MLNLEPLLINKISEACTALFKTEVNRDQLQLQETRKEFEGDLTLVLFSLVKVLKSSPERLGEELGNYLVLNSGLVSKFQLVKGFLNLTISDDFWLRYYQGADFSSPLKAAESGKTIMVEYSSPNTNKPLHLGHVRNNLLGYSVSEILKANGNKVIKANLINDRGIHICKSMLAWQKWGNEETPAGGKKGDHLVGEYYVKFDQEYKKQIEGLKGKGYGEEQAKKEAPLIVEAQQMLQAWENNDPEVIKLWETMNGWVYEGFNSTYKKLGVDFDRFYYESKTYLLGKDVVEEGLQKGVFFKKADGSVWIDLSEDGLDQKLVLRADGTSVYITQDIGTAQQRFEESNIDQLIYVVGNEQEYHFKVLQLILKKLERPWADKIYHLSYGMVDLPSGKMKSREGTVVDADELVDEMIETARATTMELGKTADFPQKEAFELYEKIGLGALKYFILKVDPKKRMLFNPAESIDFNGNTGPFIQYTYARIQSVLRKGKESRSGIYPLNLEGKEKEVIKVLYHFSKSIQEAAEQMAPSIIANYCYSLAKAFNQFYHELPILQAEEQEIIDFRLGLSKATASYLGAGMALLGIKVPDRM